MQRASQPYGSDSARFRPARGNPTEARPLVSTEQRPPPRDHESLFHFATAFWLRFGGRLGQAQRLVYAEEALFNSF